MDIKITGVDPAVVNIIDKLAKEMKMSREEFIKKYVIDDLVQNGLSDPATNYLNYLEHQSELLEIVEKRIDNIISHNKKKSILH